MVTAIMFIVVCQTALMQLYYHNTINIITICNNVQRKCNYDAVLIPLRWDKTSYLGKVSYSIHTPTTSYNSSLESGAVQTAIHANPCFSSLH